MVFPLCVCGSHGLPQPTCPGKAVCGRVHNSITKCMRRYHGARIAPPNECFHRLCINPVYRPPMYFLDCGHTMAPEVTPGDDDMISRLQLCAWFYWKLGWRQNHSPNEWFQHQTSCWFPMILVIKCSKTPQSDQLSAAVGDASYLSWMLEVW